MDSNTGFSMFPESAFCADDRPARDTVLELWADGKLAGDDAYHLLKSLMDSDAQIAYGIF